MNGHIRCQPGGLTKGRSWGLREIRPKISASDCDTYPTPNKDIKYLTSHPKEAMIYILIFYYLTVYYTLHIFRQISVDS